MINTKQYITNLKNFLPNVNSILEIQCGGYEDIENCKALQDKNLKYIGVDIIDDVIKDDRQYFRNEKNKLFMILDASNEPLPKADLVVCVEMAEYLPIPNIWSLLENIRNSQAKYFAFDYYLNPINKEKINEDIHLNNETEDDKKSKKIEKKEDKPKRRAINLHEAPFYFPKTTILLPMDDKNHFVALYKIENVGFYMDWHDEDTSKLRSELIPLIEKELAVLKPSFDQEEKGEEIFKEMMLKFLEIDAESHNKKYYYDEPYKTIIDRANGLNSRNQIFRLVYKSELNALCKLNLDYSFITENNFVNAQMITKDYIRWKFSEKFDF